MDLCFCYLFMLIFSRRNSESRADAARAICERADDPEDVFQTFIFPEGTNTNRKKLIQFKRGAFTPGAAIQPVLFRYEGYDTLDAITWTFKQNHSYLFSVWLLLVKPVNNIEVHFLPVYHPTPKEKADSDLYARNVQCLMAKELDIFPSQDTFHKHYQAVYSDCKVKDE